MNLAWNLSEIVVYFLKSVIKDCQLREWCSIHYECIVSTGWGFTICIVCPSYNERIRAGLLQRQRVRTVKNIKIHRKVTLSNKTVAIPNPDAVRFTHCNYLWEFCLYLVRTNNVHPLGYKSLPGVMWFYPVAMMICPFQDNYIIAIVLLPI